MKLSPPEQLIDTLNQALEDYNLSSGKSQMNLVFFNDAISHLTRVARILRSQRGNALLVGVGGSGRSSLTRIAISMNRMTQFSIEISKNYGEKKFHEDLAYLLTECGGVNNKQFCFMFSDSQIVSESFLEDINNILNSGEVPNLFDKDDQDVIIGDLRADAKRANPPKESSDEILAWFVIRG